VIMSTNHTSRLNGSHERLSTCHVGPKEPFQVFFFKLWIHNEQDQMP
jgi:hypothetical protein